MRTELPKKWFIQTNKENRHVLSEWRTDSAISDSGVGGYLMYPGYVEGKVGYNVLTKPRDMEELTFEEFKTLVLKIKPPEPQYEIY